MWHMQSGERVLDPNEAALFVEIAGVLVDELADEAEGMRAHGSSGFAVLDSLPWQARLQLLYDVL